VNNTWGQVLKFEMVVEGCPSESDEFVLATGGALLQRKGIGVYKLTKLEHTQGL